MKKREICSVCEKKIDTYKEFYFETTDYISEETFDIIKCRGCGVLYTDPCPQKEEMGNYYPEEAYYGSQSGERLISILEELNKGIALLKVRKISRYKKKGVILDLGCGRGLLLSMLKARGWNCFGVEQSDELIRFITEKYGIEMRKEDPEEWDFPEKKFDIVYIYHVLEHIPYPDEVLKEVRKIIKDDGILMVGVPSTSSIQFKISRSKWYHLDVPRHMVHFNISNLTRLLEKYGFTVISTKDYSVQHDAYGLMQSILNILGFSNNFLYKLLKRDKSLKLNSLKTLLFELPLNLILAANLFVPCIILEYIFSYFDLNGNILLCCKPSNNPQK